MPDGMGSTEIIGGIAGESLRAYIRRIENIQEGIDNLNDDKSTVYKDAKSEGFEVVAIRAVVTKRRKMAKNPAKFEELEEITELYERYAGTGTLDATRAQGKDE